LALGVEALDAFVDVVTPDHVVPFDISRLGMTNECRTGRFTPR
jgi:hypothetical protein